MLKFKNRSTILIALVILFLIISLYFLFFFNSKQNWNTYTNKKYNFEFEYPPDYRVGKGSSIISDSGTQYLDNFYLYHKDKIYGGFNILSSKFAADSIYICKVVRNITKKYGEINVDYYEYGECGAYYKFLIQIPLKKEDKVLSIGFYSKETEKIFSTFRFIE